MGLTKTEVEVSARAVSLPLLGQVNDGDKAKLQVDQVEESGDANTDLSAAVNLVGGVANLVKAVNALKCEQEKEKWLKANGTKNEPDSAVGVIRNACKMFHVMGIEDKEEQVRKALGIPDIRQKVIDEGIRTAEEIDALL